MSDEERERQAMEGATESGARTLRWLVLSKLARSFIWPAVLAAVALAAVALFSCSNGRSILVPAAGSALSLTASVLLFVPYFDLRVEHMIRLYRAVARVRE